MINENCAKAYCKDDISLIENYEKAVSDTSQMWQCHHRRETIFSRKDLIEIGEYYNRPACELIFLTKFQHNKLHNLGKHLSAETRKKMSESHSGENNPFFGKHHSTEARKKMSEVRKGRTFSEEHRKKISEALSGENNPRAMSGKHHSLETRQKMSEAKKGKHWYNNGVKCIKAKTCPEGFVPGRLK